MNLSDNTIDVEIDLKNYEKILSIVQFLLNNQKPYLDFENTFNSVFLGYNSTNVTELKDFQDRLVKDIKTINQNQKNNYLVLHDNYELYSNVLGDSR